MQSVYDAGLMICELQSVWKILGTFPDDCMNFTVIVPESCLSTLNIRIGYFFNQQMSNHPVNRMVGLTGERSPLLKSSQLKTHISEPA